MGNILTECVLLNSSDDAEVMLGVFGKIGNKLRLILISKVKEITRKICLFIYCFLSKK